jgi:hypothetical protein
MSQELKLCPFCGASNIASGLTSLFCLNCSCIGPASGNLAMRYTAWNNRVLTTPTIHIEWELDPNSTLKPRGILSSVKVKASLSDSHVEVQVSVYDFPLSKEYREFIEESLKRKLLQKYLGTLNCTRSIGPKI